MNGKNSSFSFWDICCVYRGNNHRDARCHDHDVGERHPNAWVEMREIGSRLEQERPDERDNRRARDLHDGERHDVAPLGEARHEDDV